MIKFDLPFGGGVSSERQGGFILRKHYGSRRITRWLMPDWLILYRNAPAAESYAKSKEDKLRVRGIAKGRREVVQFDRTPIERLTANRASLILATVNEFEKQSQKLAEDAPKTPPLGAETQYPVSIEKMSERWREIQQEEGQSQLDQRSFVEKNYLALGLGAALLIIALLVVIGGFAFLIWRAQ